MPYCVYIQYIYTVYIYLLCIYINNQTLSFSGSLFLQDSVNCKIQFDKKFNEIHSNCEETMILLYIELLFLTCTTSDLITKAKTF